MNPARHLLTCFLLLLAGAVWAQDAPGWDNQLYLGNKIVWGRNKWTFSGEIQTRLENQLQALDNWYLEFVSSYMASEHLEIVPDFRYTVKPGKTEIRPGLGVLYKLNLSRLQLVNQVKYQFDLDNTGFTGHALREVAFFNRSLNDDMMITVVAGFIYRWWSHWNGFQYIRVGPGFTYRFDRKVFLNFSYFIGVENNTRDWLWAGIPVIQLVINVSDKYRYTPAYYFNF